MTNNPISQIMKSLASRSRAYRASKKLSQQQLAARSGVSLGSLKRFESTGRISLESLLKIALTLGCLSDFEKLMHVPNAPRSIDELFSK